MLKFEVLGHLWVRVSHLYFSNYLSLYHKFDSQGISTVDRAVINCQRGKYNLLVEGLVSCRQMRFYFHSLGNQEEYDFFPGVPM